MRWRAWRLRHGKLAFQKNHVACQGVKPFLSAALIIKMELGRSLTALIQSHACFSRPAAQCYILIVFFLSLLTMETDMKLVKMLLASSLVLSTVHAVAEEQAFQFTISGTGLTGSGILTGSSTENGQYLIHDVAGTLNGEALTLLPTTTPYPVANLPPSYIFDTYVFDNVVYSNASYGTPAQAGTWLDENGLGLAYGGKSFNLTGNGVDHVFLYAPTQTASGISLTVSPVPEAQSYLLLLTGIGALVLANRRRIMAALGTVSSGPLSVPA